MEELGWWVQGRPKEERRLWALASETAVEGQRAVSKAITEFYEHWREHEKQLEDWLAAN